MSISEAKKQLSDAIAKYEHLKTELENQNDLESYTEDEWHAYIRNLGLEAAQLIYTSRVYDDDNLLSLINRKQLKLKRHSIWKKKHKKRIQQRKRQQIKRNEKWIKDIVWKVTMAPSVNAMAIATATTASTKTTASSTDDQQIDDKKRIKNLTKKLALLTEIRALRRKKMENKGHFFADEGNEFFNKVKEWHQANEATETDQLQQQQQQQQEEKQLVVHPQDTWRQTAIDQTAYAYWCGSDQSLDTLLTNRRLWDQYILLDSQDNDNLRKVPPTFVAPAPPANAIWASYLL